MKRKILHDEVIVESNRAPWKDILSVYAARVSNGNEEEVEISDKIRRAYIQALAREKAASSKNLSNLNIQTVVN